MWGARGSAPERVPVVPDRLGVAVPLEPPPDAVAAVRGFDLQVVKSH